MQGILCTPAVKGGNLIDILLQTLNLSGIPHLRSSDLEGFASNGVEQPCSIRTLYLNKTGVDDYAVPWISACESLEILEVAETKLSCKSAHCLVLLAFSAKLL